MEIPFGSYRHRFTIGTRQAETTIRITSRRMVSRLKIDGVEVDSDETPSSGQAAIRNHALKANLANGRTLEVEAGYVGWTSAGILARIDGETVHESHPGKTIAFPASAARMATMQVDEDAQRANRLPVLIDIGFGLVFFVVGWLTSLTAAAVVGAILGIGLLVVQRFVKANIVGGLALFGTVMLVISAIFALIFDDGILVQLRTSIIGSFTGLLFGADALFNRGNWLGRGMARYIPFSGIDLKRLALGMAAVSIILALINVIVVLLASEQFWLVYTTFLDIPLVIAGVWIVIAFSSAGATDKQPPA